MCDVQEIFLRRINYIIFQGFQACEAQQVRLLLTFLKMIFRWFYSLRKKKARSCNKGSHSLVLAPKALEESLSTIKILLFTDERFGIQTLISRGILKNNALKMWIKKKRLLFPFLNKSVYLKRCIPVLQLVSWERASSKFIRSLYSWEKWWQMYCSFQSLILFNSTSTCYRILIKQWRVTF